MFNNSTFFIGLDLGDKHSYMTMLDQEGELMEETRLPTNKTSFQRKFSSLQSCHVAMEVGAHSRWASHLLKELGHNVLVANARKLRAIYHNPRKGDRADAETLARLARLDPELLSPIHHRSPQAQANLALLRSRDALVRSRTLLVNHARSIVKTSGDRLPSCSADAFATKVASAIPDSLQPALLPIVETIASLTRQIRTYDQQIERLCRDQYPDTLRLREISGIGPLTALGYILTLENPDRFRRSRQVGPAIGLVPRRDQSGDQDPQLRITKTGDPYLRQLLVNAAHYILGPFGPDCDLRRWGLKLAERGGKNAKKRAVVAVARKLGASIHDSGLKHRTGRITKRGRKEIRWILVEAARRAADTHPYWKAQYQRLEPRLGSNKAAVAIARKLLVAVWHVLTKHTADRHADPDKIAFKYAMWSWKLDDVMRGGLNTRQWTRYHLMKVSLGKDLDRIRRGGRDYVIAPERELLELRPELTT